MAKQAPKQPKTVGRTMHEFRPGGLDSPSVREATNPRRAIAVAPHEAGASSGEPPAANRRDLGRTEREGRRVEAWRKSGGRKGPARDRSGGSGGDTRAALRAGAAKRGVPDRSRMTQAQLARALHRRGEDGAVRWALTGPT